MTPTVGTTQERHPWRATVRTAFQALVALCALAPFVIDAAEIPRAAPGAAVALAITGAVTRVMALPQVEAFLRRFLPFLAADKEPTR